VRWTGSNSTEQWNWDDGSGQRVMQRTSVGGTVSYTVYAFGREEHQYHASGTNTGNTSSYSVGGHLIGEQTGTSTKTTTFLLTDLLGSVVASFSNTAGNAAVQGNRLYSPYGTPLYQQGSVGTSRGFTGQYADSTSGLDYDNARYYDPLVGQFVSADSVQGNLVGMDPYSYVGGNPETNIDPTGHIMLPAPGTVAPQPPTTGTSPGSSTGTPLDWPEYLPDTGWELGGDFLLGTMIPELAIAATLAIVLIMLTPQEVSAGDYIPNVSGIPIRPKTYIYPQSTGNDPTTTTTTTTTTTGANWPTQTGGAGQLPPGGGPPPATGGDFCSFTPTTQVATDQGEQSIGKLHVGNKVWAYNPKTHKMELEPVEHVWVHSDHDLVDLTITTTTHAPHSTVGKKSREVVHTTEDHPFYTLEHGFVPVHDLMLGMHVLQADGQVYEFGRIYSVRPPISSW
jgi:RHS repeat-associated protein